MNHSIYLTTCSRLYAHDPVLVNNGDKKVHRIIVADKCIDINTVTETNYHDGSFKLGNFLMYRPATMLSVNFTSLGC